MSVSTQAFFQNSIATIQRLQSGLNEIQQQVATGRRIQRPSDDPVGASRSLNLRESLETIDQYQRNTTQARSRLQLEEQTLTGASDLLQRVRELTLQASNATQTNETRQFIATELRQNLDAMLALANTRDANDEYLFGGYQTSTEPFSRSGGAFVYNGDQGQRLVQISKSRQLAASDPGDKIFARIREGNGQVQAGAASANSGSGVIYSDIATPVQTYNYESYDIRFVAADAYEVRDGGGALVASGAFAPGDSIAFNGLSFRIDGAPAVNDAFTVTPATNTDVFSVIDRIASALEQGTSTEAQRAVLEGELNRGINGLDQSLSRVLEVRTTLGSRLSTAEGQLDANAGAALILQESLSDIEDLDYAQAISALTQQATALEAAQQSFVRVQGLSLFNYL